MFKPNGVTSRLLTLKQQLNESVSKLVVSYTRTSNFFNKWLYDLEWSFKSIELFDGDRQIKLRYCPQNIIIQSGYQVEFNLC